MISRLLSVLTIIAAAVTLVAARGIAGENGFSALQQQLWPQAEARGVTRQTFDVAFAGLTPDPRVIAATRHEPEYGKPIGVYVGSLVSAANIAVGTRKAAEWTTTLDAIEKTYGVSRWIILAIWGMESSYGAEKDRYDVFRSLATLVEARYREPLFRNELLVALDILQEGHIARDKMASSWAGAMGQTQFLPSSYVASAVDFTSNGERDIWTNVPDVLASIANYMRQHGWTPGLRWGFEVELPQNFDIRQSRASFAEWRRRGVRRADGGALPAEGEAILFFPSGAQGPAFLVTKNFVAIKEYNNSDAYALAVSHLADRMRGATPFRTAWPADDQQLSRAARMALQRKLAQLGYDVHDFDGRIDFDLRDVIRQVQVKFAMVPDGHPTAALLGRLGIAAQ
jgi:membrane-bound lytic murein transglycosylase B